MIRKRKNNAGSTVVTFVVPDEGEAVSIIADFNGWDPNLHPMRRRSNGTRSVAVELPEGATTRFRYLTEDGEYFDDPDGDGFEPNGYGETHTVLMV